jgi:hypothetical protein
VAARHFRGYVWLGALVTALFFEIGKAAIGF